MRRRLNQQGMIALCIIMLTGCFGGVRERLQSLANSSQEIWMPAVVSADTPPEQPPAHLELVGQIGGRMKGIAVQGDYAYVGVGLRLVAIDLSRPNSPRLVGQTALLPDLVRDVSIDGNYIYVTTENGQQRVIDGTNPATPEDITDLAAQPASAISAALGELSAAAVHDIAVVGDRAYLADDDGLRIAEMAADGRPTVVGSLDLPQPAERVVAANDLLYIAAGQSGLKIVNAANPAQPVEIGGFNDLDSAVDVQVSGDVAFVVDPWSGLHALDVRNPSAPSEIGHFDTPGLTSNVVVANNRAYVVDQWFGLYVVNVQNGGALALESLYAVPQTAIAVVTLLDQVAYVAAEADGLWVIDLADPTTPIAVKRIELPDIAGGLALAGGNLYVAVGESGLHVFDLANPLDPQKIGVFSAPGYVRDVDVAGTFAYIADEWSGLRIVDIANPAQPVEIASVEVGPARDVDVVGGLAYVAADEADLRVVDISDPYAPRQLPAVDVPGDANGVKVQDGYAFLAAGGAGLQIIPLSDSPVAARGEWAAEFGRDIALAGQYAYLTTEQTGLSMINVASPAKPELVERFDTFGSAIGIHTHADHVYVADGVGGLLVLKTQSGQERRGN